MVGVTSAVISISSNNTIKATGSHGIIQGIYVTLAGASGDKLEIKTGGSGGTTLFTVEGEALNQLPIINTPIADGIYAKITGSTARYLVLYE